MSFVKEWTVFVCITVLMCVVFSFLTPKGSMGRFYKMIISLFIFLSFLYPFTQSKINFELPKVDVLNTYSINNDMIESQIKSCLAANNITGANVNCRSKINSDNEIEVESVTVSVSDEYKTDDVQKIIYDNLSINAEVVHIGQ
ncbi:MAG: hypothetical protein Q4C99_11405 [Clostridia bacterium]|nr:hypothetical protein [Clostridia bacterium]